jgi:NADH-ubiquinone oxidoreductase chain 3
MELFLLNTSINSILPILAIISALFVITTQNPIYSVLNLIVLYILIAFYLIFKGIMYIGLSYVIIYVGAIAILFLFILMMIDLEIVDKRNNNYLPLLCLLLVGSVFLLKNIVVKYGLIKGDNLRYESLERFQGIFDLDLELFELENLEGFSDISGKSNINLHDYLNTYSPYPDLSTDDPIYPFISKIHLELWVQLMREVLGIIDDEGKIRSFEDILYNNFPWLNDYLFNDKIQIIDNSSYDIINYTNNLDDNLKYVWYPDRDTFFESDLPYDADACFIIKDIYDTKYKVSDSLSVFIDKEIEISNSWISNGISVNMDLFNYDNEYYMVFIPDWEIAVNRVTQISAIGDILYSVYHSYIYILSVILLLGMVGAILLTAEKKDEIRIIPIVKKIKKNAVIPSFYSVTNIQGLESEGLIDSLSYFIIVILLINILLFGVNTFLSLSMKYFDKEGGFECGFTSFVQTRERFNIVFYRVALLFLIFDLEIILIFPYTATNHNNQSISKNNVLAFLYILVVGFIFELKEGALDIVKKAHPIN